MIFVKLAKAIASVMIVAGVSAVVCAQSWIAQKFPIDTSIATIASSKASDTTGQGLRAIAGGTLLGVLSHIGATLDAIIQNQRVST